MNPRNSTQVYLPASFLLASKIMEPPTKMHAQLFFLLNLLSTWYMVGLIWMVQVVHYKMYDRVGNEEFVQYETDHNRLITPIVGPPMLVELATAALLLTTAPAGFPRWAAWLGIGLIAAIWLTTLLFSVPCHSVLLGGFDQDTYRRLVNTNWIRTFGWTARGVLMGYYALQLMKEHGVAG